MFGMLFTTDQTNIRKAEFPQKIHNSHNNVCLLFADNASRGLITVIDRYRSGHSVMKCQLR